MLALLFLCELCRTLATVLIDRVVVSGIQAVCVRKDVPFLWVVIRRVYWLLLVRFQGNSAAAVTAAAAILLISVKYS